MGTGPNYYTLNCFELYNYNIYSIDITMPSAILIIITYKGVNRDLLEGCSCNVRLKFVITFCWARLIFHNLEIMVHN